MASDSRAFIAQNFSGKIDCPAIYSRALGRSEMDQVKMNGEAAGARPCGLLGYGAGYTDRGIGDDVIDTGPNKLMPRATIVRFGRKRG